MKIKSYPFLFAGMLLTQFDIWVVMEQMDPKSNHFMQWYFEMMIVGAMSAFCYFNAFGENK